MKAEPLSDEELERLRQRVEEFGDAGIAWADGGKCLATIDLLRARADSLNALLFAERAVLRERAERAVEEEIANRDAFHDWADKLAYSIAPQSLIGEHSSLNNPWANAVELAGALRERAERAEARVDEMAQLLRRYWAAHELSAEFDEDDDEPNEAWHQAYVAHKAWKESLNA